MVDASTPTVLESEHVHQVYDQIARHFSDTRHSLWPVIHQFLLRIPSGSVVADIACGNGKYQAVRPNELYWVGLDHSRALLELCYQNQVKYATGDAIDDEHAVVVGSEKSAYFVRSANWIQTDMIKLPFKSASLDYAICIAAVHHLATWERRRRSIEEMMRCVRDGGEVMIFVWALEQRKESKRQFDPSQQDVFVPWKLKKRQATPNNHVKEAAASGQEEEEEVVYQRYYHMFKKGELEELIMDAAKQSGRTATITQNGYDRDNWYCSFSTRRQNV